MPTRTTILYQPGRTSIVPGYNVAPYGRVHLADCKVGQTPEKTGCTPATAEKKEEFTQRATERADLAIAQMDFFEKAAAEGKLESNRNKSKAVDSLVRSGMDRGAAIGWVDAVAGKPTLAGRVSRMVGRVGSAVADVSGGMTDKMEEAGIPRPIGGAISVAAAIIAVTPLTVSVGLAGAGVIGSWGIFVPGVVEAKIILSTAGLGSQVTSTAFGIVKRLAQAAVGV